MLDIGFSQSGSITVELNGQTTTITDFPSDSDPLAVDRIEVVGHQFTLNNEVFRWRRPFVYAVSLSVLPNSANDETLASHLALTGHDSAEADFADWDELGVAMQVYCPRVKPLKGGDSGDCVVYRFEDGTMVGGDPAVAVNGEGRMGDKRYSFVFGSMTKY